MSIVHGVKVHMALPKAGSSHSSFTLEVKSSGCSTLDLYLANHSHHSHSYLLFFATGGSESVPSVLIFSCVKHMHMTTKGVQQQAYAAVNVP